MAKKTKLHIIRHYCNQAVSACTAVFGMAIVRALSFFIDHARIWRYELTYKLHLKVRSFHDVLVLKSPVYKKVTENQYAIPVRNATATAFVVSLAIFTSLQYLSPYFNILKPSNVQAATDSVTWSSNGDFANNRAGKVKSSNNALCAPITQTSVAISGGTYDSASNCASTGVDSSVSLTSGNYPKTGSFPVAPASVGDGGAMVSVNGIIYAFAGNNTTGFYRYSPLANTWTTLAVTPAAISAGGSLSYPGSGDFIYAFRGGLTNTVYRYSISGNSWTSVNSVYFVSTGGSMVAPGGDSIYALRGSSDTGFYKYSISGDNWGPMASLPQYNGAGSSLAYPGSGDYIYALRGGSFFDFYRYSISGNIWTSMTSVGSAVNAGGSLVSTGGDYIYAFTGNNLLNYSRYSISGNSWTSMGVTPAGIAAGGALSYPGSGDYIYGFKGGVNTGFYRYSISNNNWVTTLAPTSANLDNGEGMVHPTGDFIYAFFNSTGFYRYSISANIWTSMAAAPAARTRPGALVWDGNNYIYAMQGYNGTGFWRYSISGNSWTAMTVYPITPSDGGSLEYTGSGDFIYSNTGVAGFYRYSISGNSWTQLTSLSAASSNGSLVYPGSGDYLYYNTGGANMVRYSISGNSWSTMAAYPSSSGGMSGRMVYPGSGDYMYLNKGGDGINNYNAFWRYSISGNSFSVMTGTPVNYYGWVQMVSGGNGNIYAFLGNSTYGNATSLYAYNIAGNWWTNFFGPSVASSGSVSGIKMDAGAGQKYKWSSIGWNTATLPSNTSVVFKARTSDDNATWSDVSWSQSGYTQSSGTTGTGDTSSLNGSRYLELQVTLNSDGLGTPTLNDFTVSYNSLESATVLSAYKSDGTDISTTANYTNESSATLKAAVPSMPGIPTESLIPQIELVSPSSTAFTSSPTSGSSLPSGVTFTSANISYTANTAISTPASIGTITGLGVSSYKFQVRFADSGGRLGPWSSSSITFSVEQTAPSGTVSIGGANVTGNYAKSTSITLTSSASDTGGSGLSQMRFSNDGTTWPAWEAYSTTKNWTLSSGDGNKTVYAQYKDNAGNVSGSVLTSQADLYIGKTVSNIDGTTVAGDMSLSKDANASNYYSTPLINGNVMVATADRAGTYAWGPSGVSCPTGTGGSQPCQVGLDTNYPSLASLISPETYPSMSFASYPAQNACKAIGGRLPTMPELLAINSNRASYGAFNLNYNYLSATEYSNNAYTYGLRFIDTYIAGAPKDNGANANLVRCVRDTSNPSYATPGTAGETGTSLVYDSGAGVITKWAAAILGINTLTSGQAVKFQVSTDGATWKGPDGNAGSWSTNYFGQAFGGSAITNLSNISASRYLYIKLQLSSSGADTPVLHDMSIQSTALASITLDTAPPTAFDVTSPADNSWQGSVQPTLSWAASSDVSGLAKYQLYVDGTLNKDNILSSATSTTPTSALSEQMHTWYVKAYDNAGNVTESTHGSADPRHVGYDPSIPSTTMSTSPSAPDGTNSWFTSSPTITLSANTSGQSGIKSTVYRWGSAADISNSSFLDSGTSTYTTAFDMTASIGNGDHYLFWRSVNNAGGSEIIQYSRLKLDTVKPLTGYSISPSSPNGNSSWYVGSTPQITLTSADAGGANASGVATTKYQWDSTSGSWSTGTSLSMIQGDHVLYYYTTDNAGNDEFQYEQQHIKFDNAKPLNPTNFTAPLAESSTDTIVLHWDASLDGSGSGAIDYQIRRKKDSVLSWNDPSVWTSGQLGNVQIYHDNTGLEAGYKYNYQIRALDMAGNWEDWPGDGTKTIGYTIDNQAPTNPTNVTVVACDGTLTNCSNISHKGSEIKLTWTISADNGLGMGPDSDLNIGHYRVYRSTSPSLVASDWTLIGIKDGGSGSVAEWYDNNANNAATFDIGVYPPTDTKHGQAAGKTQASAGLNDYTQYYYRVTALDVINNESALVPVSLIEQDLNKNVSPVATPDVTAPTQPSAVTATSLGLDGSDTNNPALDNKHQRVSVNWAPSVDCKALVVTCNQSTPLTDLGIGGITYKVYRSTTNYATRDEWLANATLATTTSAETYEDNGLSDTTTYYYRVMASDSDGNPSLFSSVDPNSSTRTFNSNVPSAPADVVVSSQKGDPNSDATVGDKITVSFKGSNSKGDQIVKYEVYRYKSDTNDLTATQWLDTSRTTKLKLTSTGSCGNQCLSFSTGTSGSDISITPNQADRDSSYQIVDMGLDDASTYFYRVRAQDNANVPNQPDQSNRFGPLSSITSLNSGGANKFGWDITPDATAPDQPSGLKVKDIHDDGLNFKRNIVTWSRIATPTRGITNDFREYRIYRSDDGLTWSQICKAGTSTTLLPSCTVGNPNPLFNADKELSLANNYYMDLIPISAANQFYYYYVTSVDDAGSVHSYQTGSLINSGYSNESKATLDSENHITSVSLNPAIAQPSILPDGGGKKAVLTDVGVSTAVVTWTTDQPADTIVEFKKHGTSDQYIGVVDRSMTIHHQITAKPLDPNTTYDYRIVSRNSLANDAIAEGSDLPVLTTSGFTIAPGTVTTTTSTAEIKWTTNLDASSSFVEYQLQTQSGDQPQGGTSGVEPSVLTASPRNHDVVIKGLRSNRTYTFKIKSISRDGYLAEYPAGAFSNFKTRNFDSAQFSMAPSSSNVADRNITSTTAQIIWQTANQATSWVDYGTASGVFGTSAGNDNLTTTHVVTLEGLVPGTTYYYHVRAKDENEVEFTSQEYSFTAVIKPKISNMQVKDVSPYSVTIAWITNVDTETVLNWGTTASYGAKQGTGGTSQVHQVTINNLEDNTEYHYQIVAHDSVGNEVVGADGIVRTPLDTSGPKISSAKIDVLPMGENDTTGTIIVSWQTDKPATTLVEYDQGILGGDYNNKSVEDVSLNTTHTVIIKNLQPASSYHYRMVSADKRSNTTLSDDYTFVTPSKEKSIIELIVKSLEDTFAWTRNLNQFFGNLGRRFTAGK